jgi:hypothetical protein
MLETLALWLARASQVLQAKYSVSTNYAIGLLMTIAILKCRPGSTITRGAARANRLMAE